MAQRLLVAFVAAATLLVAAVVVRLIPAQPDGVWLLAALPITALLAGPRTRLTVALAIVELATLVPLHAFVTLVRAMRLEGG